MAWRIDRKREASPISSAQLSAVIGAYSGDLNQAILWTQQVTTAVSSRSTLLRFVEYLSRMCATEYGRDKSYGMIGRP
jgi:hypothetical protein